MKAEILSEVYQILKKRKKEMSNKSYTSSLFKKGDNHILKKIGEESTELVMASVKNEKSEIIYEAADLFFHIMVLLAQKNIELDDIFEELKRRQGTSGLEEKAKRDKK